MSLSALALILGFLILGDSLEAYLQLPVPGSVLGLMGLFSFLVIKKHIPQPLEQTSQSILQFLPLYFVPVGVGVITLLPELSTQWPYLTLVLLLSTMISLAFTAMAFNALNKRQTRDNSSSANNKGSE